MIHEKAALGFDRAGDEYHKGRPEYPREAVEFMIDKFQITDNRQIVDLGAGTGKFSKLLIDRGLKVTAIEPVARMREKFKELLPDQEIIEGTAEKTPLPDGACDVVIVAQAFHWFNGEKSLSEIKRILRPKGYVALIWNVRDESVDWVLRLTNIIDAHEAGVPRFKSGKWKEAFREQKGFTQLEQKSFNYIQTGGPEMVINLTASMSFISALPESKRKGVIDQVENLLREHPSLAGKNKIDFPYRTDLFWCQKVCL